MAPKQAKLLTCTKTKLTESFFTLFSILFYNYFLCLFHSVIAISHTLNFDDLYILFISKYCRIKDYHHRHPSSEIKNQKPKTLFCFCKTIPFISKINEISEICITEQASIWMRLKQHSRWFDLNVLIFFLRKTT